jgi:hypothetical protein
MVAAGLKRLMQIAFAGVDGAGGIVKIGSQCK